MGEGRGEGNSPFRSTRVHLLLLLLAALLATTLSASAISKSTGPEEIPPLRPPRGEIPPTFWEKNHSRILLGTAAVLAVACLVGWRITRTRYIPAPEAVVVARKALEALRHQPEDGVVLSRVSQVLRRYFQSAFALPSAELTTTEFNRLLAKSDKIKSELSSALGDFLKRCDERKFSAPAPAPPLDAVPRALTFIDQAEALRHTQANAVPPPVPAPPQPQAS